MDPFITSEVLYQLSYVGAGLIVAAHCRRRQRWVKCLMTGDLPAPSLTLHPDEGGDGDAEGFEGQRDAGRRVRPGVGRVGRLEGYSVNFTTFREDIDATPLLKGLPDDRCQCPHWGYVIDGKLTIRYADREEVFEAGDAFYTPPGHVPVKHEPGTEIVHVQPRRGAAQDGGGHDEEHAGDAGGAG